VHNRGRLFDDNALVGAEEIVHEVVIGHEVGKLGKAGSSVRAQTVDTPAHETMLYHR
jgi:hypothetical protein